MSIKFKVKTDLKTDQINGIVDSGMVAEEVAKQCENLPDLVKAYIDSLDVFNNIVYAKDTSYPFPSKAVFEKIKERFSITDDQYTEGISGEVIGTGENGALVGDGIITVNNIKKAPCNGGYTFTDFHYLNHSGSSGVYPNWDTKTKNTFGVDNPTPYKPQYREYYWVTFHEDITVTGLARSAGEGKTYNGASPIIVDNGADVISLETSFVDKVNSSASQTDLDRTNTNVSNVTDKANSNEIRLNTINSLVTTNTANITTNTTNIGTLDTNVTKISSDLTNVENKQLEQATLLQTNTGDINDLKDKNTSLNASISDLSTNKVDVETFTREVQTQQAKNDSQDKIIDTLVNDLNNWRPNEYMGEYDIKFKYKKNQTCSSGNDLYLSKVDNNKGNDLKDPTYWLLTNYSVTVNLDGYATLVYTDNEIKKVNSKVADNTTQLATYNQKFADMREQIKVATDSVDTQHDDLEIVKGQITNQQAQIEAKADRSTTVRDIELLNNKVTTNTNSIGTINTSISTLTSDVNELKTTTNTTKENVSNLTSNVNDIQNQVINPKYNFDTEYQAYILPNGKQVYKMLKQYVWKVDGSSKKLDDIPLNFNMISYEGSWEYTLDGKVIIKPLGYVKPSLNSDGSVKKIEYYILSKFSSGYYIENTWYSNTTATITFWIYYTKD